MAHLSDRTINPLTSRRAVYQQQANSPTTYTIDYSALLGGEDTVASSEWSGPVSAEGSVSGNAVMITVDAPAGTYTLVNRIVTAQGRYEARTLVVEVQPDALLSAQGGDAVIFDDGSTVQY